MTPIEIRKAQEQILQHVSEAGELADVASVLIKFVYHLSPNSYFNPRNTPASEWVLKPRGWVNFYFSTGRYGYTPKIIVSIDAYPDLFKGETHFQMRQGEKVCWSKFEIRHAWEIKDALHLLWETHRISGKEISTKLSVHS